SRHCSTLSVLAADFHAALISACAEPAKRRGSEAAHPTESKHAAATFAAYSYPPPNTCSIASCVLPPARSLSASFSYSLYQSSQTRLADSKVIVPANHPSTASTTARLRGSLMSGQIRRQHATLNRTNSVSAILPSR